MSKIFIHFDTCLRRKQSNDAANIGDNGGSNRAQNRAPRLSVNNV